MALFQLGSNCHVHDKCSESPNATKACGATQIKVANYPFGIDPCGTELPQQLGSRLPGRQIHEEVQSVRALNCCDPRVVGELAVGILTAKATSSEAPPGPKFLKL